MKAGDTFLAEIDRHLWVVLSDPDKDPERVLLVSITTITPTKDQACILPRGCHPWVTHDSCVAYGEARVCRMEDLTTLKNAGKLQPHDPLKPWLLQHIRESAADSTTMAEGDFDILLEQGLVEE